MMIDAIREWFNNTPHDMGKTEFDELMKAVDSNRLSFWTGKLDAPVEELRVIEQLQKDNEKQGQALKEIVEIYAGMDGFIPETAPEAYQKRIIRQMYEAAKEALNQLEVSDE